MIVAGILGARLFFVIQKWDEYSGEPLDKLVFKVLNMTEGGLVVYGSLIGSMIAALVYLRWNALSVASGWGHHRPGHGSGSGDWSNRMLDERMLLWRRLPVPIFRD